MDVIRAKEQIEAETFFKDMDRYDALKGPAFKLADRVLDWYRSSFPPSFPGETQQVNL